MQKSNILSELSYIFKDVLDNDKIRITEKTTAEDIEEWDSLTHIQLIVAIEKHFNIRFSAMAITKWKNVGELTASIEKQIDTPNNTNDDDSAMQENETLKNNQPDYKKNYINKFPGLKHGKNCFIAEGVTLTNVTMGERVWINKFATVYSKRSSVKIGNDCYIGPYVWIEGQAGIEIGNFVHIGGPGTNLHTHSGMKIALNSEVLGNPGYDPENEKTHLFRFPIRIGNNVWIGPNCSISPGVIIKDFVVIMANTLVKSGIIESYSLVHGDGVVEQNSEFVKSMFDKK